MSRWGDFCTPPFTGRGWGRATNLNAVAHHHSLLQVPVLGIQDCGDLAPDAGFLRGGGGCRRCGGQGGGDVGRPASHIPGRQRQGDPPWRPTTPRGSTRGTGRPGRTRRAQGPRAGGAGSPRQPRTSGTGAGPASRGEASPRKKWRTRRSPQRARERWATSSSTIEQRTCPFPTCAAAASAGPPPSPPLAFFACRENVTLTVGEARGLGSSCRETAWRILRACTSCSRFPAPPTPALPTCSSGASSSARRLRPLAGWGEPCSAPGGVGSREAPSRATPPFENNHLQGLEAASGPPPPPSSACQPPRPTPLVAGCPPRRTAWQRRCVRGWASWPSAAGGCPTPPRPEPSTCDGPCPCGHQPWAWVPCP